MCSIMKQYESTHHDSSAVSQELSLPPKPSSQTSKPKFGATKSLFTFILHQQKSFEVAPVGTYSFTQHLQ